MASAAGDDWATIVSKRSLAKFNRRGSTVTEFDRVIAIRQPISNQTQIQQPSPAATERQPQRCTRSIPYGQRTIHDARDPLEVRKATLASIVAKASPGIRFNRHIEGDGPTFFDLTRRFPLIVETLARLRSRSCIIDGEAVACDDNGLASFDLIRYRRHDDSTFLYAFDLIELNGDDLRRDRLEVRKATPASIVAKASPGIRFNEHMEGDGPTVFSHACKMGLEGIVSKRKNSMYRSGRSPDWLKMKNPAAPAVKPEDEEDWRKTRRR